MSGPSSVLRSVWDAIPSTNCKGWCVESCGPIGAGPEETRLLAERGVLLPDLLAVLESVVGRRGAADLPGAGQRPLQRLRGQADRVPAVGGGGGDAVPVGL